MMDFDPFSMLEISLRESDAPAENIQVDVDPLEVIQDGQVPPETFSTLKDEVNVMSPSTNTFNAMQMVIKNGNTLAIISPEEEAYRRKLYKTMNVVLRKRLHCTICDAHIGCHLDLKNEDIEHPLLKVLACSRCTFTYKYIDFPLTPEGKDVRCRWCTKPSSEDSPLRFCQYCPFAFCEMCIYRNLPLDELARNKGTWMCFVCNISELWPSRAVLWALHAQIQFNQSRSIDERWKGDVSQCCKSGKAKKSSLLLPRSESSEDVVQTNGHQVQSQPQTKRLEKKTPEVKVNSPVLRSINTTTRMERPKPLPASKYETYWLKEKIQTISTTLQTLNTNLNRVSKGIPDVDDKFNIKSKMISLTSLLNIGANQINTYTKELESEWKKVLETKSYKTVNKGVRRVPTPYRRAPLVKTDNLKPKLPELSVSDETYLKNLNIKPCFVKLTRLSKADGGQ